MNYEIGDTVVHWTHGLGKVVAIDEMDLAGTTQAYYVVQLDLIKVWVPFDDADQGSIRPPMEGVPFRQMLGTLRSPGKPLLENAFKRKIELRNRIQKRTAEELCLLIRDLTTRSRNHVLNQNDSAVLFRAEEYLLDEWVQALGEDRSQAQEALDVLLSGDQPEP